MKKLFTLFWLLSAFTVTAQKHERQPLDIAFGDPFILYDKASDRYYMYGTGGVKNGFRAYSSPDLKNWKEEGPVYTADQPKAWGIRDFWAPEVYAVNGKYYLFYSAHWKENPNNELENYKIGVAVADKPTGPFEDVSGKPLFDPGYPIIDANVFFDENGKLYLYFSRCCYKHPVQSEISDWAKSTGLYDEIEESWVYGVQLKPDFSGVIGEPKLLLRPPVKMNDPQSEWESRSVTSGEINRRWTEGSFLFKHNGIYYMTYSANHFAGENYAVGYATASHPLGPFIKSPNNPILEKDIDKGGNVSGTGHNMLFTTRDGRLMVVYHGRTPQTGNERVVFIEELTFDDDGHLMLAGAKRKAEPAK